MTNAASKFLAIFLYPGDRICDLVGVPADSDHRQVLRSFLNMIIWSAIAIAIALALALRG